MIPLARPDLGATEEALLLEVLRSRHLSLGPRVRPSKALRQRIGVAHVSAVSSGTAGLHLALRAAGVRGGDEVVTSPFTFVATANAVVFERARPVFGDIDPRTLNLDPAAAGAAVAGRTTGLLPVHIFGYPADLPALSGWLAASPIVEDACEALGARHADGSTVGGRGNPAVFGFYPTSSSRPARAACGRDHRRGDQGAGRQRAQPGPGARPGLARPRPARLQLPTLRRGVRARHRPARAAQRAAGRTRGGRRALLRRAGGHRGAGAALPGRGRRPRDRGSCTWCSCREGSTATR